MNKIMLPKLKTFPNRITLELTNACNYNCVFCPRQMMDQDLGFMDLELAIKLIDEMAENLPVTLVPFFRGEPLLHVEWFQILQHAKRRCLGPIQLTTNGSLLDSDISEMLLDLELDFISFSMDTIDPMLYEKTRRGSPYDKVLNNILNLIDLKEHKGLSKPEIQVSAVETKKHVAGIDNFVNFWRKRVDRVRIYVEHSRTGDLGAVGVELPSFTQRFPCHKVFTDLVIYWNGKVALCNHDWVRGDEDQIGDVRSQSIAEVWSSSRYRQIREEHLSDELSRLSPCSKCDHWKMYYLPEGLLGRIYTKK